MGLIIVFISCVSEDGPAGAEVSSSRFRCSFSLPLPGYTILHSFAKPENKCASTFSLCVVHVSFRTSNSYVRANHMS